jgi:betaine-aldehyde dehydrogenase
MMAAWKVGPALAAGCALVLKPSEYTPFTALELGGLAAAAGVPPGVLNVVLGAGALGAALVAHPLVDKVAFTGSAATGARVGAAAAAGIKRCTLELGGKSPAIVHADAELDGAAEWLAFGAFYNAGQICSATARVLVHESIAEALTARLAAAARSLRLGAPFDAASGEPAAPDMGPSCNRMQFDKVAAHLARARAEGARFVAGGEEAAAALPPGGGFWTAPTVLADVTPAHAIFREEVFGPVMTITTFKTEEEALALANDTEYGLAAAVFSADPAKLQRAARAVKAGVVWLNNAQPSPHALPWGGFKKSGIGRELGPMALMPYLEQKAVLSWPSGKPAGWYAQKM